VDKDVQIDLISTLSCRFSVASL